MNSHNGKILNRAVKVAVFWYLSICVVGFFAYFLPLSVVNSPLAQDLSNVFPGINRLSKGSVYFFYQIRLVWIYIAFTIVPVTILLFFKMDFTFKFNDGMRFSKVNPIKFFLMCIALLCISFFLLKVIFLGELFDGKPIFYEGYVGSSFKANAYSKGYSYTVFINGGIAFSSVAMLWLGFVGLYHLLLRFVKRIFL
jgi:hypothetical protein